MPFKSATCYDFGPYRLEEEKHRLLRQDQEIDLRPKSFGTLHYLLQHPGRLVEKDELLQTIWSGSVVSETTLSHCIEEIRSALQDDAHNPRYIKTIHRLGYKFIGQVTTSAADSPIQPEQMNVHNPTLFTVMGKRRLGMVAMLFLLCVIALWYYLSPVIPPVKSLAVLPFLNLSADATQDYFVDGMTEALIARLARIEGLRVISRTSVMQFKGTQKSLPVIAQELGVDAVVEGSAYHSAGRVRVTVQLIHARQEAHLWAETYERPLDDLLTLHDELAQAIAKAISTRLLSKAVKQPAGQTQPVPQAYEAYLKGRYFLEKRREGGFIKGLEFFQLAVRLHPQFAPPFAGMADCYNMLANYDLRPPAEVAPQAKSAALQALALDENLAEAHASLGFTAMYYDWDWVRAEQELCKAITLNPNNSEARHWYALLLMITDRYSLALQEIKQAQTLDPVSLIINTNEGWLHYFNRQYDRAEALLKAVLEMDPEFASAHIKQGWVLQQTGRTAEAVTDFVKVSTILQNDLAAQAWLCHALALAGEKQQARQLLYSKLDPSRSGYVSPYLIACIHVALGDQASAWPWLARAYEQRSGWLVWLKLDPKMDPLRSDPRFIDLVRRVGL